MRSTINPTTAMEEIMGMNSTVSSEQLSECGIIKKIFRNQMCQKSQNLDYLGLKSTPFLLHHQMVWLVKMD